MRLQAAWGFLFSSQLRGPQGPVRAQFEVSDGVCVGGECVGHQIIYVSPHVCVFGVCF